MGQEFGAVSGSVYAQFLQRSAAESSPQLETWQTTQSVTQEKCNFLKFTIFSKNERSHSVLVLTTTTVEVTPLSMKSNFTKDEHFWSLFYHTTLLDPFKYSNNPVFINISILPCPPGFMLTSEPPYKCECSQLLQSLRRVKCHIQNMTIDRSGSVWVGTLKNSNETVVASEYCSFDYCNKGDSNVTLSEPDSQCNYNHSDTLCGGC